MLADGARSRGRGLRRRSSPRNGCRMGGSALFGTGTDRSGRSRPGSAPSRSGGRRSGTARRTWRAARRSGSRRTSCRNGRAARSSLDALLPVLYLRGISTGDFQEALAALLGDEAPNLSPGVISRLTAEWQDGLRALAAPRSLGPPLRLRLGRRRLPAGPDGARGRVHPRHHRRHAGGEEGAASASMSAYGRARRAGASCWSTSRPAASPSRPRLAVGDGALGFWKALDEVFPGTRHQRCWVHKVANVLNKFPKSMAPTVKSDLRDIWQAETRAAAQAAMDTFAEKYGAKYGKRRRLPDQGPRGAAGVLRLPGRALGSSAHRQPDRERLRHGPAPDRPDQGRALAEDGEADGLHPRPRRLEEMAPAEGRQPVASRRRWHQIHRRCRHRAMPQTAPPDQAASPRFSHSSG